MKFTFKLGNEGNKTLGTYSISFTFTFTFTVFTGLFCTWKLEKCLQIINGIIHFQYNIPYNIKPVSYFNQQSISGTE